METVVNSRVSLFPGRLVEPAAEFAFYEDSAAKLRELEMLSADLLSNLQDLNRLSERLVSLPASLWQERRPGPMQIHADLTAGKDPIHAPLCMHPL